MRELPEESDAVLGGLVDLPFDDLAVSGDSVLAHSLRRRMREMRKQFTDSIGGHDACLIPPPMEDAG